MPTLAKIFFALGLVLSFTGLFSPPIALTLGILFGLSFLHPFINESRGIARTLLQSSVVALGFGMNLHEVLKAGRSGFVYTALGFPLRFWWVWRSASSCRSAVIRQF